MGDESLQSQILTELSYTDMTEEALSKRLKSPVHRELSKMEKEKLVKKVERRDKDVWTKVGS